MNKLELKEIVGYLPYELKVKWGADVGNLIGFVRQAVIINGDFWRESQKTDIKNIKPILFPLSSLTQFREDLRFVPIDFLEEKYFSSNLVSQCERLIEDERWIYHSDYILIQYFYEWKIDIHNLIEKGLAISVTEEFNPYK
jgi:hypothetical protein